MDYNIYIYVCVCIYVYIILKQFPLKKMYDR